MIKLFTDSDLDGSACALIAELAFEKSADITHCTYRNLNQRVESFLEKNDDSPLFITDLSVNEEVEHLLEKRHMDGGHVQMIDHHASAIHFNDYEWGFVEPGSEKKTCAATLFYDYLVEREKIERNEGIEQFLELVRKYDTWEWEEDDDTDAKRLNDLFSILGRETFKAEMLRRLTRDPDSFSLSETEEMILDLEERKISRYIHKKNYQIVQTFIDEYCVGIIHAESYHSELGNELNKRHPHLDLIAIINIGNKRAGFRTIHDEVDVSEFAGRFGGGGHPKASGCELTETTYELFVAEPFAIKPLKSDADRNKLNRRDGDQGSFYENHDDEVIYIRPVDNTYEIMKQGEVVDCTFHTFDDAERYVKRQHHAWLRSDERIVEDLTRVLPLSKDELFERYDDLLHVISYQKEDSLS
ncbi:DHH family phosphoesterase [Guptibacillus algicola]|uniref:DHH family phosphoesterase n=1 Tax=Guptibacillus algicola TaxID=225844 RepID=UPI001CD58377|nr:oligoribonuclease [Alkalihalobacillus algicola]MCA0987650.1 oligoribonuclease [Alkalihalobacillus algicola]